MSKDRALRRHEEIKAKKRDQKAYNSCIGDLPESEKQELVNNVEKLRKVCVATHLDDTSSKDRKKTLQEKKHDITMREQLQTT